MSALPACTSMQPMSRASQAAAGKCSWGAVSRTSPMVSHVCSPSSVVARLSYQCREHCTSGLQPLPRNTITSGSTFSPALKDPEAELEATCRVRLHEPVTVKQRRRSRTARPELEAAARCSSTPSAASAQFGLLASCSMHDEKSCCRHMVSLQLVSSAGHAC